MSNPLNKAPDDPLTFPKMIKAEVLSANQPEILNFFREKMFGYSQFPSEIGKMIWTKPDGSCPVFTDQEFEAILDAFKKDDSETAESIIRGCIENETKHAEQTAQAVEEFLNTHLPALVKMLYVENPKPIRFQVVPSIVAIYQRITDDKNKDYSIIANGEFNYQKNLIYITTSTANQEQRGNLDSIRTAVHEYVHHLSESSNKVGFRMKDFSNPNDGRSSSPFSEPMTELATQRFLASVLPGISLPKNEAYMSEAGIFMAVEELVGWEALARGFTQEQELETLVEKLGEKHAMHPVITLESLVFLHEAFGKREQNDYVSLLCGDLVTWVAETELDATEKETLRISFPNLSFADEKK
jgi:hypothetical protein